MSAMMDALVLHGIGNLKYEKVPIPDIGKDEVLLEIKASGICGSDIARIFTKGTYSFPLIPGHEFSGMIVKTGADVDPALLGSKAAVFPMIPCLICDSCKIGEYSTCSNYDYFGSRKDGGFARYQAVPLWNLVIVPESLSFEEAAMAEPAAVAIHALRRGGISIGDTVAIAGAGPIGLMLGLWAKASGAENVFLWDIDEMKVEFAKKTGFANTINSSSEDPVEFIMSQTNGKGIDLSIEGAGVSITLEQCIEITRPFGTVVTMGNPIGGMHISQKKYWEILRKQLTIKGTWNSSYCNIPRNEWTLAINAMASGKMPVKNLITHKVGLDEAMSPFIMMQERKDFFNKVMFVNP
ncbi:MAG: galactitol-1-phosphate 5-dehydrogenase [Saccharofermentanales bacterium]